MNFTNHISFYGILGHFDHVFFVIHKWIIMIFTAPYLLKDERYKLWVIVWRQKLGTGYRLTKLKQCECFHETLHFPGTSFTHGCMKVSFWSCSCFHVDASQKKSLDNPSHTHLKYEWPQNVPKTKEYSENMNSIVLIVSPYLLLGRCRYNPAFIFKYELTNLNGAA